VPTRHAACNSPGNSTFSVWCKRKVALHPWESAGEAGREEEFEVEELFLACPPFSPGSHGLELWRSEECFRVIYSRELVDHLQQRTEVFSPRQCRAMGH
jgi:hypothetical protein